MVLKLLYSASDSVQVLRCFYVRRSIGSVEKSSGVRFYTATPARDERLKSAGKGRAPLRMSLPSAGATRSQGGDHMRRFLCASRGNIKHTISILVNHLSTTCRPHILCRSPSTLALGTYSIGPPRFGGKTNGFAFRADKFEI